MMIKNPILRGFNPDPSILRVKDDFYIAVSTFEWFPGVVIYHSKDLANWKILSRPLDGVKLLDMAGNPSSGGVWAPCLSYDEEAGLFYLIYSNVRHWVGSVNKDSSDGFKDTHNYLTVATDIKGPWSNSIYLNSSGFDPSLFHDDDGRKWLINMQWDYRIGKNHFAGILLQEYDADSRGLVGSVKNIFRGTDIGLTEGPHLYKRNGWYYLITAEGGTSYAHAVTLARSRNIEGPYEVHPQNPLMTSVINRNAFNQAIETGSPISTALHDGLQKAGHGSMCPWTEDEWILAHLCARPLYGTYCCPLGRETSLQKLIWKEDDWPYAVNGFPEDRVFFSGRESNVEDESVDIPKVKKYDDFDGRELAPEYHSLRIPADEFISLKARPGCLRLYGQESISSTFRQSLIARRVQNFRFYAETCLEFYPDNFKQMAGLILRYNERNQYYLRLSRDEQLGSNALGMIIFKEGRMEMPVSPEVIVTDNRIYLSVEMVDRVIQFYYSIDRENWQPIGFKLNSETLSDEMADPMGFTGMFVGIACQDLSGRRKHADFDYFLYEERK